MPIFTHKVKPSPDSNSNAKWAEKKPVPKRSVWDRIFHRRLVVPVKNVEAARDLSASFNEHTWDTDRLVQHFPQSNINAYNPTLSKGLSHSEVARLLAENGENTLPKAKEVSDLMLFVKQFLNLLWLLLIVAASLSLLGYLADTSVLMNLYVTVAMFVMIFIMCCISFWQEREARRVVRGFANLLPESCAVLRDGKEESVSATQLVVGDIILIKNGSRVPADARVLVATSLKLETSSITGEAEPVDYKSEAAAENVTVFESRNIAFNGSMCVDGYAVALVIRTGVNTIIGQIAAMTTSQGPKPSQLEHEISRFVKFLVVMATTVGLTIFVIGGFVNGWHGIINLLANGFLVCAIGMVPCGLPATVTSILTLVARQMADNNVYLKRLDVVECLGSASIIASDKTGTLTKNVMTVTDLWYHDTKIQGYPEKIKPDTRLPLEERFSNVVARTLAVMTVCNIAEYTDEVEKKDSTAGGALNPAFVASEEADQKAKNLARRPATGSPSEIAMLNYVDRILDVKALRKAHNMVFEVPFNSARKYHLRIMEEKQRGDGSSDYLLMMKGAPEILIKKCSSIMSSGGIISLDNNAMERFQAAYQSFAEDGRRVIGFVETRFVAPSGTKFSSDAGNFPQDELTFVAMCAIMDPPRDETAGAIESCKLAGIRVFMVTGDHPETAAAIARQIGLIGDKNDKNKDWDVIHGERISRLTEEEWDSLLMNRNLVFARTTPEQKLLIVEQCQKRGETIAMTGDGVNDSPALKKANIGIAMGSGSEVAKQAADIILMDDNFASIVKAIEQGRLMFDNIKKLLGYTMPHSYPEVYPVVINFALGMPMGISPLQILTIDLGTELLPGISMCKEPIENSVMRRPPRKAHKKLVSNGLLAYGYLYTGQIQSLACLLAYLYVFWHHGINTTDLLFSAVGNSTTVGNWKPNAPDFFSNGKRFTSDEQDHIRRQACSAWQIGIVFGQFWHVWSARTRRESIFVHGLFSNRFTIVAVTVEIALLVCYNYIPGLNHFLGGAAPPAGVWGVVAGVSLFIFFYNEVRKYCIRRWPKNMVVHWFKW